MRNPANQPTTAFTEHAKTDEGRRRVTRAKSCKKTNREVRYKTKCIVISSMPGSLEPGRLYLQPALEPGRPMDRAQHRLNTGRTQAEHKPNTLPNTSHVCRTALAELRWPNTGRTQAEHKRLPNTSRVCRTAFAEHRPNTTPNTTLRSASPAPNPGRTAFTGHEGAHLKQHMAKCRNFVALLRKPRLS